MTLSPLGFLPRPRQRLAVLLGRHQLASLAATLVDFSIMVLCVRNLHATPSAATVVGATCGALTNFTISRHWTFDAAHQPPHGQALRYALVSAASLGLNTLGEYALAEVLSVQFVLARAMVALGVGLLWNFPMHKSFVFGQANREV